MATPRTTRSRGKSQTPVPAISSRSSDAYGAKGKTNLRSQVDNPGGDFAAAFGNTRHEEEEREDTNAPEDDQESISVSQSPAKKRGRPPKGKAKQAADLSIVEEEEDDATGPEPEPTITDPTFVTDRPGTGLEDDPTYGAGAGLAAELARPIRPLNEFRQRFPVLPTTRQETFTTARPVFSEPHAQTSAAARQDASAATAARLAAPAPADRPARATLREAAADLGRRQISLRDLYLYVLLLIFGFISFLTFFAWTPLPAFLETTRTELFKGMKVSIQVSPYDRPPDFIEESWIRFRHTDMFKDRKLPNYNVPDLQWAINLNFQQKFENIYETIAQLKDDLSLQSQTLSIIKETLPDTLILREVNGKYEIPEKFWPAIQDRLAADTKLPVIWTEYLKSNENQLEELLSPFISRSAQRIIDDRSVVTKEFFLETLKEKHDELTQRFEGDFRQMQHGHFAELERIAERKAHQIIKESPAAIYARDQVEVLAKTVGYVNHWEKIHNVNHFSIGLGAIVSPHESSKAYDPIEQSWQQRYFAWFSPKYVKPNPPGIALTNWEEMTHCFCPELDPDGSSKITIITGSKVYAEKLVIEHIPAHGTNNIRAAPKTVELWAVLETAKAADQVRGTMTDHLSWSASDCGPAPSPESVCIGRGEYSVHADNHEQSVMVSVDTQALGLGVKKFTVKVVENWGEPQFTCLYRLRLNGDVVA